MGKNNFIQIYSRDLKKDMIIAKDIYMGDSKFLTKGAVLSKDSILKLREVFPYEKFDIIQFSVDYASVDDNKIKNTEVIFETLTDNVDKVIDSVKRNSQPNLEDIRNISKNILSEVTDYSYALKSISNERNIDEYLLRHSINVAVLSSMIGGWLKFSKKDINLLTYAGLLHDIGKTKISSSILNKSGKLTENEFKIIKKHPIIAYEISKKMPYLDSSVQLAILMHHERIDGSGYPLGLSGDNVTKFARILAIADMYDAMTSHRPYNDKFSPFKALEILQKENLNKLDPIYLTTFLERMSDYLTGEYAELSNGKVCKIIQMDVNDIGHPLICTENKFIDLKNDSSIKIKDLIAK